MEKQIVVNRVKDILAETMPVFKDDICCERTPLKNCFQIRTFENKDWLGQNLHLCFCVLFKDDENFIPSIFCSVGKCDFVPEPGASICVRNLEKGIEDFISKIMIKKFLSEHLQHSEFATA